MDKLNKILSAIKVSFHLTVNPHRDYYETVDRYLENNDLMDEVSNSIIDKMKELNTIIEIIIYPETPVGSYVIYHYDIDKAFDEAMDALRIN